jgi:hypothetical protein
MLGVLSGGIALWIAYGVLRGVITAANSVSLCCLAGILSFQLRSG